MEALLLPRTGQFELHIGKTRIRRDVGASKRRREFLLRVRAAELAHQVFDLDVQPAIGQLVPEALEDPQADVVPAQGLERPPPERFGVHGVLRGRGGLSGGDVSLVAQVRQKLRERVDLCRHVREAAQEDPARSGAAEPVHRGEVRLRREARLAHIDHRENVRTDLGVRVIPLCRRHERGLEDVAQLLRREFVVHRDRQEEVHSLGLADGAEKVLPVEVRQLVGQNGCELVVGCARVHELVREHEPSAEHGEGEKPLPRSDVCLQRHVVPRHDRKDAVRDGVNALREGMVSCVQAQVVPKVLVPVGGKLDLHAVLVFEKASGALFIPLTKGGLFVGKNLLELGKRKKGAIGLVVQARLHVADDLGAGRRSKEKHAEKYGCCKDDPTQHSQASPSNCIHC